MTQSPRHSAIGDALRDLTVATLQARADLARAADETRANAERITADTTAVTKVIAGHRQAEAAALGGVTTRLITLRRGRLEILRMAEKALAVIAWHARLIRALMFWLAIRWWLAGLAGLAVTIFLFLLFWPAIDALLGGWP